jgi:hypothetical protein
MVMDNFFLKIYLGEINKQCNYALQAAKELNISLEQGNTTELFRAIHGFLIHASNVSKLLWSSKESDKTKLERAKNRADTLRNILNLPEEHPLKDRKLRNYLEHYDTRLDDWVYSSTHHNYIDMNIGPKNFMGGNTIQSSDIMRHFDPATNLFIFRGEEFDLQEIATEIKRVALKIEAIQS